ncbi:HAD-IA family hydrolase (plasmid) [Rhizobium grahamii]|uniref:HAD-IA family hydrolase n=1 Tax=Rhizobium grahamii TaxID=1120045 RepID=A0A5Q0CHW3_9HYPH|nr:MULTISPECIES: HAD-IA family hydrolase [Rhizobium]QFY63959.1 HAD-IA family hydrolase [Rhizobium grahamii]QRM52797.1 HAD-IA family hydrolase [Rhizobium sp. BG6]
MDGLFATSFEAFLFDMDGTILNSAAPSERVWGNWARKLGIPTPNYHGRRANDTVRDLNLPGVDPDAEGAAITAMEIDDVDGVIPIPGAREFLSQLPAERWAVVTSAPKALALRRIAAAGLPSPHLMISAEDISVGKPAPDCYLAATKLLSVNPARCLVFEDADVGISAGEAAGCAVLAITETRHIPLTASKPQVENYLDIRAIAEAREITLIRSANGN